MTRQQAEIVEKRRFLRQEYGGLMTLKDLAHELGFRDPRAAKGWAVTNQIRAVRMPTKGGNVCIKYDTDHVAQTIVKLAVTADMMI